VEFLKVWSLLAVIVLVGFLITYQYVGAPPPKVVRIATGANNGAYYTFAQEYARLLASDGITLEVVSTAGSIENLELLKKGEVSLALIQGGSATKEDKKRLQSLGSLFLEPVWIFVRKQSAIKRFLELKGKRVSVGIAGSGTHLLATQLLSAAGITQTNTRLIREETMQAIESLSNDKIDAAFSLLRLRRRSFISSLPRPLLNFSTLIAPLLTAGGFPF
jgi:TRAP transporter TAXI family solute receptor